ncbi:hypothetical protein [uncultured Leifsonia sp.]|uniref:hypothetical protein n=1 Tax=uncultured Leifsonia sp. TaxID=340359 RepID=UPI0025EE2681|nr:hypothetical protein [uncultured Leifsonia sp.]
MNEPTLIPRDALAGRRVGLSVSQSADLETLGLSERHCRLVVAEVTRAILLAGGTVVYGGRLKPEGYTRVLLDEIQRFKEGAASVEIVLAEPEFQATSAEVLDETMQRLGTLGALRFVSHDGQELSLRDKSRQADEYDAADAYTSMRKFVARNTDARVVVGGQLAGYKGREPGIIEEARLSLEAGAELYIAGGYGGAAALLAIAARGSTPNWMPQGFPRHAEDADVQRALERFLAVNATTSRVALSETDARVLEASHRPADIATTVARALAADRSASE